MITYILLILLFICLSAFFSGTETALITADKIKLQTLSTGKRRSASIALKIFSDPEKMVATMLVGTNISLISSAAIATAFAEKYFPLMQPIYVSLIMTGLILVFGEILPKAVGRKLSTLVVLKVSILLRWIIFMFSPVVYILTLIAKIIIIIFGLKQTSKNPYITRDEIQLYFRQGEEKGIIDKKEKELIYGIFDFTSTYAREIMIPLVDIIMLEKKSLVKEAAELLERTGHSQLAVFDERVDNLVGYLNTYELFKAKPSSQIEKYINPAFYVPETKRISELFNEMEKNKISMAFVVDEFGGASGLITAQNIAEEIIGKLKDFHQPDEETLIAKLAEKEYKVNATVKIDDLNKELAIDISKKGFETLGGFIMFIAGKIPRTGEKFEHQNMEFEIDSATEKNILSVIIKLK